MRSSLSKSTTGSAGRAQHRVAEEPDGLDGHGCSSRRRRQDCASSLRRSGPGFPRPRFRGVMTVMTDIEIADPRVEQYAVEHTTPEPPWFATLAEETRNATRAPTMMVGTLEGRLLTALVAMLRPRSVLEIGTFTGYSALSMAEALPPGGRIVTCDISEEHLAIARRHIAASPYAGGDRDPVRPCAGDDRDAAGAVRPGLHRRRQDQLLGVLRGHPAQAGTRRRDPGRQRAVERPGARPRDRPSRTPRPSRRSTTRCSPTSGSRW